jgi:hypothetical protein
VGEGEAARVRVGDSGIAIGIKKSV